MLNEPGWEARMPSEQGNLKSSHAGLERLIALLARGQANDYVGEPVSQLEHALQAAFLARRARASESEVIAALCHDIGHWCDPESPQMSELGTVEHEKIGQCYLKRLGMADEVADLVAMHVDAKRYQAAVRPRYFDKLSDASMATLVYQGGVMRSDEIEKFEQHPMFDSALRLRAWDEAAKVPDATVDGLETYRALLARNVRAPLEEADLLHWKARGWLHIKGWLDEKEILSLRLESDRMQAWPDVQGRWMKYYETASESRRLLCRLENFLQYSRRFDQVCRGFAVLNLMEQLFGEPAFLFKEKINFKLPGGGGFSPHQDAPAFTTFEQRYHVTAMLSLDATTKENGCLEIADWTRSRELLDTASDLTLTDRVCDEMKWQSILTQPGDLLVFDSYVPHRSSANRSEHPRRVLYSTYSSAADGDLRDHYFEKKRALFPPDIERQPGQSYESGIYNVGNPISVSSV